MVKEDKGKKSVTHAQIVRAAKLWTLEQRGGCCAVMTEFVAATFAGEIPDVLGFRRSGMSIMIECKANRNDFLADRRKLHRQNDDIGLGMEKWYMVAPDVIKDVDEIPDEWGCLLFCKSKHERGYFIRVLREASKVNPETYEKVLILKIERRFLISAVARALEALRLTAPLSYNLNNLESE